MISLSYSADLLGIIIYSSRTATMPRFLQKPPNKGGYKGIPFINSSSPSLPTVIITSPSVLVKNPASQYVK